MDRLEIQVPLALREVRDQLANRDQLVSLE